MWGWIFLASTIEKKGVIFPLSYQGHSSKEMIRTILLIGSVGVWSWLTNHFLLKLIAKAPEKWWQKGDDLASFWDLACVFCQRWCHVLALGRVWFFLAFVITNQNKTPGRQIAHPFSPLTSNRYLSVPNVSVPRRASHHHRHALAPKCKEVEHVLVGENLWKRCERATEGTVYSRKNHMCFLSFKPN